MVKFVCKKIDPCTGEKFPTKKEWETFANNLLNDYCKIFKRRIESVDYDEFISKYLKIDIQYQRLSLDDSILGVTILKDCKILTYSYDGSPKIVEAKKGDIYIDVKACKTESRTWFTTFHEIKHKIEDLDKNLYIDKIIDNEEIISSNEKLLKHKTKVGWAEYFANHFAACILLNKSLIRKLYKEKHTYYLTNNDYRLSKNHMAILKKIIVEISNETEASQSAIAIRLKDLNLITYKTFKSLNYKFGKEAAILFRLNANAINT